MTFPLTADKSDDADTLRIPQETITVPKVLPLRSISNSASVTGPVPGSEIVSDDDARLNNPYASSFAIITTSSIEGFPIFVSPVFRVRPILRVSSPSDLVSSAT